MSAADRLRRQLAQLLEQPAAPDAARACVHDLFAGRDIVLYGAGSGYITFSQFVLSRYGFRPTLLLDRKFDAHQTLDGIPALSPDRHVAPADAGTRAIAVVTVGKEQLLPEIFAMLRGCGYTNVIHANDIYEYHLHYAPRALEEAGSAYYGERRSAILAAFDLLADDESREVFCALIETHVQRRPRPIPHRPLAEQYFPRDLTLHRGYRRTINCGSYDGDTVRRLKELHGPIEALACFEPDPVNYGLLCRTLAAEPGDIAASIASFPCGVLDRTVTLRFGAGKASNSAIDAAGDTVIQCVAIDDALPGFAPTFINMDIEGAEPAALAGAARLIRESRPDLAVCVYHSPSHLWEIPLQIAALRAGYRFYLRNYTGFAAETVLYATHDAR